MVNNLKNFTRQLRDDDVVDEYVAILTIVDQVTLLQEHCGKVLNNCAKYISQRDNNLANFVVDDSAKDNSMVPHDPGCREPIQNDAQRTYLIELGPHQPILSKFPSDGKNRFNVQWYKEFPFLEYSTIKDAAYCFVCYLFPKGVGREKSEDAWITVGVKNWGKMKSSGSSKQGKLALHFKSASHKNCLYDYSNFLVETKHIDILLDKTKRNILIEENRILSENTAVVKILIDISKTLARQGLAFRGNDDGNENFYQIVSLFSRHNSLIKHWLDNKKLRAYHSTYISSKSQNEFIELIGGEIRNKIIEEVEEAPFFTIMADHTPDSSHKDILSLVIRIVDKNGNPKERLISISEAHEKTGDGIAKEIIHILQKLNINVSKLVFQSYDFASAMSGKFKGTQQKLSELVGHKIIYVPCQAHRINTAVEHCCQASPVISDMFNILEELYVFFSASNKRHQILKNQLEELENALSLKNLSKTRWTARAESLQAVNIAYEKITAALHDIENHPNIDRVTKGKAYGLSKRILSFDFICCLMFLKTVLYKLKIITELMESSNLNIIDSISEIEGTITSLSKIRNSDNELNNLIESAKKFSQKNGISPEDDFQRHHRRRVAPRKLDESRENTVDFNINQFFRKEFITVLDTGITFLQDDLKNVINNMQPIKKLFSLPLSSDRLSIQNIQSVIELYPPGEKPDVYALQGELEVFFDICIKSNVASMNDIMNTAKERKAVLKLSFQLCQLIFTAGYSVAKNERSHSTLKFVKNELRSLMGNKRLDSLMLIKSEKDLSDSNDFQNIISSWAKLKTRRIKILQ